MPLVSLNKSSVCVVCTDIGHYDPTASERTSQFKTPDAESLPSVTSPEVRPADGISDTLRAMHEVVSPGENDIIDAILSENYQLTHPGDTTVSNHMDTHTTDAVVNGISSNQKPGERPVEGRRYSFVEPKYAKLTKRRLDGCEFLQTRR